MVLAPSVAKLCDVICEELSDIVDLLHCEAVAFLELHLPQITKQIKFGSRICAHNVHMRWGMIVEIDHDSQATEAQDGGHGLILPKNA
jgi:hypothetical protein